MTKRQASRWQRGRRKAEARVRAKAAQLRDRLAGASTAGRVKRHRRMMQAAASAGRRFPYHWANGW